MAIGFTPDQKKVIEARNSNILVSAAAGSGKTAVLVERIVQMVCDEEHPVDIDRLLVVTFTNAAAAEMRERVGAAIAERLTQNPDSEHLQRQAILLHNALITTIDSFSLFLLRNHFHKIGLDPAFRVADEGEIRLLQQEVLEELLEDFYARQNPAFEKCVETFCPGGKEKHLEEYIQNLSRYASSFPWPAKWLKERKKDYEIEDIQALLGGPCGAYLNEYLHKSLNGCIEKLQKANGLCLQSDGPYMYGELLEKEIEMLEKVAKAQTVEAFAIAFETISFDRLPGKKDDTVNPLKREAAKNLRDEVKAVLQKQFREAFFATPFEVALRQSGECGESVAMLIDLTLEFDRRMKEKKQEKKIVDFSDMEHYALEILWDHTEDGIVPSQVAYEYREHFKEILIDEYQDSNTVQEELLRAVSGEDQGVYNRFMVGDVKQSIYKFRLARPELFHEKYNTYKEEGNYRRIDLSKNFRSRGEVLSTVNDIFERVMSKECGGIDYDENARLYVGAEYPENQDTQSELCIVEEPDKESKLTAKQAEALLVAEKILACKREFQVTDKATKRLRPAQYSDMVILLRTNSGWDEEFKEVLEKKGIPVYITSKTGYFDATEVQEILNALRVFCNPLQDIPLFGMMKSVFGGFSEEEIAVIREKKRNGSFYEALKEDAEQNQKTADFLRKIAGYREKAVYLPIRDLIWQLVEDHNYLNYVSALPAGEKRRANVEMLFTKAAEFAKTNYFGLFHFIRYIEQLEKYDVDYGEADTLDENADVVRIISIHKSKGLEFPITFVSGMGKRINQQDADQPLLVDMDLGLGTFYFNPDTRLKNATLRKKIISSKIKEDNLAEELRILYVALTRAKEKLIMTASMKDAEEVLMQMKEAGELACERLSFLDFIKANSYMKFILPVLEHTNIQWKVHHVDELSGKEVVEQVRIKERMNRLEQYASYADEEKADQLRERFARVYPYENLKNLYTKTTVSELKIAAMSEKDEAAFHAFEEKEVVPYIPAFRKEEEEVTGTVRGNAYHRAMELLDFDGILSKQFSNIPDTYEEYARQLDHKQLTAGIQAFLQEKCDSGRLTEEYMRALRMVKITHFVAAPIGYRMWKAQRNHLLYREQPFVLGIEASRLKEEFPREEQVLIQGIIDVFFVEEDKLVLLDYKTDVIPTMEDLWNRYQVQLDYYSEALERLLGKQVKEKILYSFHLER